MVSKIQEIRQELQERIKSATPEDKLVLKRVKDCLSIGRCAFDEKDSGHIRFPHANFKYRHCELVVVDHVRGNYGDSIAMENLRRNSEAQPVFAEIRAQIDKLNAIVDTLNEPDRLFNQRVEDELVKILQRVGQKRFKSYGCSETYTIKEDGAVAKDMPAKVPTVKSNPVEIVKPRKTAKVKRQRKVE